MKINPLTQIDFYKTGHIYQYPAGTESVYSNFTARSSRLAPVLRKGVAAFQEKVVNVGLQGFIKEFLIEAFQEGFFSLPREKAISAYKRRMDTSLGPGVVKPDHIAALYDLGYLPLRLKALPEGARVNIGVPVYTVQETDKRFAWLTNYLETVASNMTWKPITVATISYEYRRLLEAYADLTGADKGFIDFQAHDFSSRGMSGPEDAARSSFGHLASFTGSDAVASIDYAEAYYGADADKEYIAGGVPATEHSVMSMGGELDEFDTYRRLVSEVYPSGIVSIVSDTWDYWNVLTDILPRLKEQVLARTPDALGNAKVVVRPDSGDPVLILTGYLDTELVRDENGAPVECDAEGVPAVNGGRYIVLATGQLITAAERKGSVQLLWDTFGGTETAKGFKVLNSKVGLIYGDSITLARANSILERMMAKGFASSNVVMGVGSFSYQYLSRDSFGFAMKATSGVVNGERRALFKDPKTGDGTKKSARGLLRVEREGDNYVLYDNQTEEQEAQGELKVVFEDGKLVRETTLAEIRATLRSQA